MTHPRPGSGQLQGHVLTPEGWRRGRLAWRDGRIATLDGAPLPEAAVRADVATPIVLPGFVDLHLHGGGGADTMDAGDAVHTLARAHARRGTTSLLATTMTAPLPEIEAALRALAPACAARAPAAARVLGVHLEGPYIHPGRLGAQPDCTRPPSLDEIRALAALAPIRVVTLAPDGDAAIAMIPALVQLGLRVQLGHSGASYEQGCAALAAGASGFTHLFNAMSGLHHRAPGLAGAALAHGEQAELIADGQHLHDGTLRLALRAIPRAHCVSDATSATGMPDGDYRLGRQTVHKRGDSVRLADGTLAGSAVGLDLALRRLVALGLPLAEASARCSTHAADYLGLAERGRLAVGAWADLVQLDPATLRPRRVVIEGEMVDADFADAS